MKNKKFLNHHKLLSERGNIMQFVGDIEQPPKKVHDPDIYVCNEAVMQGRATEYITFVWPHCALPTPQTFLASGSGLVIASCG